MAAETESDLPYVGAREWVDVVSRLRLDTVQTPKTKVAARTIKAIAFRLAWWADGSDGTRVFPGPARIAVVCQVDYKTVKRVYEVLRDLRLITLVSAARGPQGKRSRVGDEYRLTIPSDLLDRVQCWSPLEMDREIERVREVHRGKRVAGERSPRNSTTVDNPVDNSTEDELRGNCGPATEDCDTEVAGKSSPADEELRGNPGSSCGETQYRIPSSDQNTKSTNHDPDPAQPPDARDVDEPNDTSSDGKCDAHGLAAGTRTDGQPCCPLCRREGIAPVIPLRANRNAS